MPETHASIFSYDGSKVDGCECFHCRQRRRWEAEEAKRRDMERADTILATKILKP